MRKSRTFSILRVPSSAPTSPLARSSAGVVFAAAALATLANAGITEESRLFPNPRLVSQIFGLDLSFDGSTIACGAAFENQPASQAGAVYLFQQNASNVWVQTLRLHGPSPIASDWFGIGVAIEGTRMLVGAGGRTAGPVPNAGATYVYENLAGVWNIAQTLTPSNPIDGGNFGDPVALHGTLAAVGSWTSAAPSAGGSAGREIYIYEQNGGVWTESVRLPAPSAYSNGFTASAAITIDGERIAVGGSAAPFPDGRVAGAVFVFEKIAGMWQQTATLTPPGDPVETRFGQSVAFAGDRIVVGAPNEVINGNALAGAVYVFERLPGGWQFRERVMAETPAARDFFGVHVAATANQFLVGAYQSEFPPFTRAGYANLYQISAGAISSPITITASDGQPHDIFGWRTALHGDRAVITAPFHTLNEGAVYVFRGVLPPCPADLDQDGSVGLPDLALLLSSFGSSGSALVGDIDADDDVDLQDLSTLLSAFGTSC